MKTGFQADQPNLINQVSKKQNNVIEFKKKDKNNSKTTKAKRFEKASVVRIQPGGEASLNSAHKKSTMSAGAVAATSILKGLNHINNSNNHLSQANVDFYDIISSDYLTDSQVKNLIAAMMNQTLFNQD